MSRLSGSEPRDKKRGSLVFLTSALVLILAPACVDDGDSSGWDWNIGSNIPAPSVPEDNPMSVEKVELGRHLFYDIRLSGNQTQSCSSCHRQDLAFTDGLARSEGSTGEQTPRSSMSLANVAYVSALTWVNPLLRDLSEQALIPMFGEEPVELGLSGLEDELLERLRSDTAYQELFMAAYPDRADPFSLSGISDALATFQRTLLSFDAPYDRYIRGDDNAMSAEALRGMELFNSEELECFHCHGGFNFTDSVDSAHNPFNEVAFHNNGLYNVDGRGAYPAPNLGYVEFTGAPSDQGRFRAPSLRNIAVTAPYMHDGSIDTLDGVLEHYAAGGRNIQEGPNFGDGRENPNKSGFVNGFELTETRRAELLAFLNALTDENFLSNPSHSDPFAGGQAVGQ